MIIDFLRGSTVTATPFHLRRAYWPVVWLKMSCNASTSHHQSSWPPVSFRCSTNNWHPSPPYSSTSSCREFLWTPHPRQQLNKEEYQTENPRRETERARERKYMLTTPVHAESTHTHSKQSAKLESPAGIWSFDCEYFQASKLFS